MASAFIRSRTPAQRALLAAAGMAPTMVALWAYRVDIPRGRAAAAEARRLALDLGQYGAVVIPPYGLETQPTMQRTEAEAARQALASRWGELRLVLQRFWRAAASDTIDIDDPQTWPDAKGLGQDWKERHKYTLRAPVAPLSPGARQAAATWTRGDGAPQLVLAAFLDPSMERFHFGDDSHRYVRLAVSPLWYWLPWAGPPSSAVGIRCQQQGWRVPCFPTKPGAGPAKRLLRTPHLFGGRQRATALAGPLGQGSRGAATLAELEEASGAPGRSTEHMGSAGPAPGSAVDGAETPAERRVGWFASTAIASVVSLDAPVAVGPRQGAPVVVPGSHRVVAAALRRAAEDGGPALTAQQLSRGVARWGTERCAALAEGGSEQEEGGEGAAQVPLAAGARLLMLGCTVRSLVWPAEALRGPGAEGPAMPLVWHEAGCWAPYRRASEAQTEPSSREAQAFFDAVPAEAAAARAWLTGEAAGPGEEAEARALLAAMGRKQAER